MHEENLQPSQHDHTFGRESERPGERRTSIVVAIRGALTDGLHMTSNAGALRMYAFACVYARRNAHNARLSFSNRKVK